MSHPSGLERFDQLLSDWCEATLAVGEQEELLQLTLADQALRRRFILAMQLQITVETHPSFARSFACRRTTHEKNWLSRRSWRSPGQLFARPTTLSLAVSTVVIGLLVTAMAFVAMPTFQPFAGIDRGPPHHEIVARLQGGLDAVWQAGQDGARPGSLLVAGSTLRLLSGLADIRFYSGATVVLEGPAELTVDSRSQATLHDGRLTCVVSPSGRGFVVETPTARFVDIGTEFGVNVDPERGSDLLVLQGEVEATSRLPQNQRGIVQMVRPGEALRFDIHGGVEASPLTADQFTTSRALPLHVRSDVEWPDSAPLSATGWNVDFILGNGETHAKHQRPVNENIWFAENSTVNEKGLPASGAVTAAGVDFQFQSFTNYTKNALHNNGTLTLVTPGQFSKISLLGSKPGTDTTATLTLNFSDAPSSGAIPLTFANWIGTSHVLPNPRLTATGTSLSSSFSGAMSVFTYDLVANGFSGNTLQSITVQSATANAVFALNGVPQSP